MQKEGTPYANPLKCNNCMKVYQKPFKYEARYIGWAKHLPVCGKCYRKISRYDGYWASGLLNTGGKLININ